MNRDQHESVSLPVHGGLNLRGPIRVRIDYHPSPKVNSLAQVEVIGLHDELRAGEPEGIAYLVGWISSCIENAMLRAHHSNPEQVLPLTAGGWIEATND